MLIAFLACAMPEHVDLAHSERDADDIVAIALDASSEATLGEARIWSGLSAEDDSFLLTTMVRQELVVYRVDDELDILSGPNPITAPQLPDGAAITDHAQVLLDGIIYVAISDHEARDLWLVQADPDGAWASEPLQIANDSRLPTHDMQITTDGELVWLAWGNGTERAIAGIDRDLRIVEEASVVHEVRRSGLGSTVHERGGFTTFSGDESNRSLIAQRYSATWEPELQPIEILGEDDAEELGDWHWFPSGSVRDEATGSWVLAFTTMPDGGQAEADSAIQLALLDKTLQLVQTWTVTPHEGWTRPHLALSSDTLMLSYDAHQRVIVERFDVL